MVSLRPRFLYEQARTDWRFNDCRDRRHYDHHRRDGQSCCRAHNHHRGVRIRSQTNRRRATHSPDSHSKDRNNPRRPDSARYRPDPGPAPRSGKLVHLASGSPGPAWLEARPKLTRAALRMLPACYTAPRTRRYYGLAVHTSRNRQVPLPVRKLPKVLKSAVTCGASINWPGSRLSLRLQGACTASNAAANPKRRPDTPADQARQHRQYY